MASRNTKVGVLCSDLGITRQTLYRQVDPEGNLRPYGQKLLNGPKPATKLDEWEQDGTGRPGTVSPTIAAGSTRPASQPSPYRC